MNPNSKRFSNPVCQACIAAQLKRYDKFAAADNTIIKDFRIQCDGIPESYLTNKMMLALSPEEQQQAKELLDPVEWAKKYTKNEDGSQHVPYWYQEAILRCTARRKITRLARRLGKTTMLAITAGYRMYTRKNYKVLVVAPQKSQAEEIISRLRRFLYENETLARAIKRDRSSPYFEIELNNGSRIRAFSSGTKSGSEAVGIRGQDADLVVIDEADYLLEADLDAIMAILATTATTEFWGSSTPSGRRSHFYKWCLDTPTYKAYHHQMSVLPHWDLIKDQVRADYAGRPDGFVHEVLAEFGEQNVGVFQNALVDGAKFDYTYESQRREGGWVYSIGVDWNSNFGTEICVVGMNPVGQFKVVESVNIPKQNWTHVAGLQGVIQMNAKWLPNFIYADEGHGALAIEMLRKVGNETLQRNKRDPAARLRDIVKHYNFSAKIDIHEPLSGKIVKKPSKPFLVENAVRFFEESRLMLSAQDADMFRQLGNYIIKHYTNTGLPVYGQIDETIGDHKLDALMLALVGFKLEMTEFGHPTYSSEILMRPGPIFYSTGQNQQAATNHPEVRYNIENDSLLGRSMPGNVDRLVTATTRPGWETDEEEKFQRINAMRRLKKKGSRVRNIPTRSKF